MVTQQIDGATGRRGDRLAAAVALCILVAALPCVAAATDGSASADHAPDDRHVGAAGDRPSGATAPDRASASTDAGDRAAALVTTPVSATRSQLVGVVLVLLVLAGIGVAAWGARPNGLRRLDRASSVLAWVPGGRVEETDDVPSDAAVEGELLTDEERIIELLEQNGGRLKQQHVVETTDWSKAKVSRLLSSMEDEDSIVRIQLGREKLIFLSGHEPSGARPAHREDG